MLGKLAGQTVLKLRWKKSASSENVSHGGSLSSTFECKSHAGPLTPRNVRGWKQRKSIREGFWRLPTKFGRYYWKSFHCEIPKEHQEQSKINKGEPRKNDVSLVVLWFCPHHAMDLRSKADIWNYPVVPVVLVLVLLPIIVIMLVDPPF